MSRTALSVVICTLVLAITGCGSRRYGDPDGRPTVFEVTLQRDFVAGMHRRSPVGLGAGVSVGRGGIRPGIGLGITARSTSITLLAGEDVGSGRCFRQSLRWGRNRFTVPIRSGRDLVFTIQAQGGREGFERIGALTITGERPLVTIDLDADGADINLAPEGGQR